MNLKRQPFRLSIGLLLLALLLALGPAKIGPVRAQAATDLIITGVIDGPLTGGLPKAVEFYVLNDIADLSIYGFGSANNGGGSDGQEFTFPADPATAGAFIYVATESTGFSNFFGFAPTYTHGGAPNINGDDAIELFQNGAVVDLFGEINVSGAGQPWEYTDGWAYRVNATGPDGATFVLANWSFSGPNALDGETTNAAAASPFPIGTYSPDGGGDTPPNVANTVPANGATNVAQEANIEINFNEPVTVTGTWFDITCTGGAHTASVGGGPQNFTLDPDNDFASADTCTVTIFAAQVTDQDETPDNMAADYSFSFSVVETQACGDPATLIHQIQGSGPTSPLNGTAGVVVEGIVVGDYQNTTTELSGFFIQEEDSEADPDPATSEGIFVFDPDFTGDIAVGDVVRVQGDVTEFQSSGTFLTELNNISTVLLCSSGAAVTPAAVTLPVADLDDWEQYEGMLINISQELTVSENFTLGRFGEVVLSIDGRLFIPTHLTTPGAAANNQQDINNRSRILLDDANLQQNIDPTRYPAPGLSASNTLRSGDTLNGLTGVLEQRFGAYRVQPVGPANFSPSNPRPAEPNKVGGSLKVASFNVLNYFTTLDTGNPICGPLANQDCRGANSSQEFTRQRDKIINAINAIDADIVGLMELENSPDNAAIQDLVNGLNAVAGAGTYGFIDTGLIGSDAIRVALIYKPATVSPAGSFALLTSAVNPLFDDTKNRPALAQTFEQVGTGERLTVVVNHLKSKGSDCNDVGDPDIGDGQGNCNITRTNAATALVNWLVTDPTGSGDPDFLIIGDLNSYAMEDPITAIKNGGYTNLIETLLGGETYSFVFGGQSGYLDHALATASLVQQVTGVTEWHINADEPIVLDYNTEFKSANHVNTLYDPGPYRSADHDPVLVGLSLSSPVTGPQCNGVAATIYVNEEGKIVGGPNDGNIYHGVLRGTADADVMVGTDETDVITGFAGDDLICSLEGKDVLTGLRGNDTLYGGGDKDLLQGGPGQDTCDGGDGVDIGVSCETKLNIP